MLARRLAAPSNALQLEDHRRGARCAVMTSGGSCNCNGGINNTELCAYACRAVLGSPGKRMMSTGSTSQSLRAFTSSQTSVAMKSTHNAGREAGQAAAAQKRRSAETTPASPAAAEITPGLVDSRVVLVSHRFRKIARASSPNQPDHSTVQPAARVAEVCLSSLQALHCPHTL